jgi:hypothetical protein
MRDTKKQQELKFNREAELIIKNQEDEELIKLSGKEKEKTIKCLLKVL